MSTPHFTYTPAFFKELPSGETPSLGQVSLYAKTDGKMYYKDDLGVETEIGGSTISPDDENLIVGLSVFL